jgi:hypothetical protein
VSSSVCGPVGGNRAQGCGDGRRDHVSEALVDGAVVVMVGVQRLQLVARPAQLRQKSVL